jgi:four helix bundle protein
MQDFRKLEVWQLAHTLTLTIYRLTKGFPSEERFGITDQMRRAAISIESNLAEGCGRGGDADFARFVQMAFGSACELECQLLLACDLKFVAPENVREALDGLERIKRMLSGLLRKLKADSR